MSWHRRDETLKPAEQPAVDAIELEIRRVLSARPSVAFLAGARQRCAAPSRMNRRWLAWPVAAGALATLTVIAALLVRTNDSARRAVTVERPGAGLSAEPSSGGAIADRPDNPSPTVAQPRKSPTRAPLVNRQAVVQREPEVLVPPGQLEALRALVDTLQSSVVDAQPMELATGVPSAPRLAEITVAGPIVDQRILRLEPDRREARDPRR
jgi:hypothetical protein